MTNLRGDRRVKNLSWLAALLVVTACQETPEQAQARVQSETEAARPLIQQQLGRYVRGASMGNADSLLAVYTADAIIMPPNRPALTTRDQQRAAFAAVGPYQVTFATHSLVVNGDIAIERGMWQATMSPPGSTMVMSRDGKYLAHWHRVNGEWLMAEHIWNDDYQPIGM